MDKKMEGQTDTQVDILMDVWTDRLTSRKMDAQTYLDMQTYNCLQVQRVEGTKRWTNIQDNRQLGRWMDRQIDTWTDDWMQVQRVEGME
jgi:hypothetical protein